MPRHARARALSQNKQMIGQMAIARDLPGFNDLGRTVTPTFLACENSRPSSLPAKWRTRPGAKKDGCFRRLLLFF